jgi:hypothetical protein
MIETQATPTTMTPNSGEVSPMVTAAKTPNVASPLLNWLREEVEVVEELRAELCVESGGLGCCGARA